MLVKHLPKAAPSFIYKMLRKKNITLNGKKATGNELLKNGDYIEIFFSDETYNKFRGASEEVVDVSSYVKAYSEIKGIKVIYEDNDTVFLNKPVGVLSQKAAESDLSLNEWLIGYLLEEGKLSSESLKDFKPSVCNRLDRNTAGIVLCSKTLKGSRALSGLIKDRKLDKFYLALVKGTGIKETTLSGNLIKDNSANKVKIKLGDEEEIRTDIKPVSDNGKITLIEAELFTGKTHQIRASMAAMGHPLVGDYKYGDKALNDLFKDEYGLQSQFLVCYKVKFHEDTNGLDTLVNREIQADLPDMFDDLLKKEKL